MSFFLSSSKKFDSMLMYFPFCIFQLFCVIYRKARRKLLTRIFATSQARTLWPCSGVLPHPGNGERDVSLSRQASLTMCHFNIIILEIFTTSKIKYKKLEKLECLLSVITCMALFCKRVSVGLKATMFPSPSQKTFLSLRPYADRFCGS